MTRQIAFDTETTGLDPESGHRVVEIGCVELINNRRTGESFHCYINPQRDMPAEAERVHGLSAAFLSDKPLFGEVADGFIEFIQDSGLIIHNAGFDMKFINYELQKVKKTPLNFDRVTDTLIMARKQFPGAKANLDALCQRFHIDLSAREKHGALLDAELLADVYLHLMGGGQSTLSFGAEKKEETTKEHGLTGKKPVIPPREFTLSKEEEEAHLKFVEELLKEPVWKKNGLY